VTHLVVAVSVAGLMGACGGSTQVAAKTGHRYTGPAGWSLRYPVGTFLERSSRDGLGALWEITFASFAQMSAKSGENIDLGPPRDRAGVFPTTSGSCMSSTPRVDPPTASTRPARRASARRRGPTTGSLRTRFWPTPAPTARCRWTAARTSSTAPATRRDGIASGTRSAPIPTRRLNSCLPKPPGTASSSSTGAGEVQARTQLPPDAPRHASCGQAGRT
jgi:hypothetical protein